MWYLAWTRNFFSAASAGSGDQTGNQFSNGNDEQNDLSSFNFHFEDELDTETQTLPEDISEIFANDNDDTDYGDMIQLEREDYDEVFLHPKIMLMFCLVASHDLWFCFAFFLEYRRWNK